jgi:hypothetical protein
MNTRYVRRFDLSSVKYFDLEVYELPSEKNI